jgi:hypothetical protein
MLNIALLSILALIILVLALEGLIPVWAVEVPNGE